MQVGTTKDQGLYNKPSAAVHPGALAAGTLLHNITKLSVLSTIWHESVGCVIWDVLVYEWPIPKSKFHASHVKGR